MKSRKMNTIITHVWNKSKEKLASKTSIYDTSGKRSKGNPHGYRDVECRDFKYLGIFSLYSAYYSSFSASFEVM